MLETIRGLDRFLEPPDDCLQCSDAGCDPGDCGHPCHMTPAQRQKFFEKQREESR